LDTFEEAVIFSATSSSFLVRVMAKNLLAVGTLNLLLRGLESVLGQSENSVVILALRRLLT
jgi:hypothetical protein